MKKLLPVLFALALLQLPPIVQAGNQHQSYDIPHTGDGCERYVILNFDTGAPGLHSGLKFILGGNPVLKILRIVSGTGEPNFSFGCGASPHDVTLFFVSNPFVSDSGAFLIAVQNPSGRFQTLSITAVWDD
jgi:hypothetical protein